MPKEIIARCDWDGGREELVVNWTKQGDLDPMIGVGSWRESFNPDGSHADWEPLGPQWALGAEGVDQMIKALNRAKRQLYPSSQRSDRGWKITVGDGEDGDIAITVLPSDAEADQHGFTSLELHYREEDAKDLATAIMRRIHFGV